MASVCPVSEGLYKASSAVIGFLMSPASSVFPFVTYFLLDVRRTTCHWEGMLFEMTGPIFMNQGVTVFLWPGNMMSAVLATALLYISAVCLTALPKAIADVCTVIDTMIGYPGSRTNIKQINTQTRIFLSKIQNQQNINYVCNNFV